jgi:hypothetical protein
MKEVSHNSLHSNYIVLPTSSSPPNLKMGMTKKIVVDCFQSIYHNNRELKQRRSNVFSSW